jgi:ribonuclease HI
VPDNPETAEVWRMYFDGSLKLQGAGAGILFIAPGGEQLKYALRLLFPASNNVAEYEALIHGLNIAISLGIKRLMVYGDSLVVISQINKEWDCSNLEFLSRNTAANALSKLGSSRTQVPPGVFAQEVLHPSISLDRVEECNALSQPESDSDDWRGPIIRYIKNEEEPDEKMQPNTLRGSHLVTLSLGKRYTEGARQESS